MPADQNRSLTPVCSELMRNLPLDRVRPDCRALVERAMFDVDRQLSERQGKTSALLMDHATRTRILAEYDRGNRRVAKAHFGRDRLFSDPLPPADAALADPRLPADSGTLVTDFLAPLIESLMAHVGDRLKQPPTRRRPQHK